MSEVTRYWLPSGTLTQQHLYGLDDTCVVQAWAYDQLKADNDALRAELAALKAGQGEAVYQLPSHARGDKWYGFGYVDFSSREDLSRLADYLKDLLDDVPETPLYTAPPASADAVSVPRELLERTISNLLYGSARGNAEELRALLAQSESKG